MWAICWARWSSKNEADAAAFDEAEQELLTTVAANLAVAISNLRQVEEIQASRATAEMLYEAGQRITRADETAQILSALVETPWLVDTTVLIVSRLRPTMDSPPPPRPTQPPHPLEPCRLHPPPSLASQIENWPNHPLFRHANRARPLILADIAANSDIIPASLPQELKASSALASSPSLLGGGVSVCSPFWGKKRPHGTPPPCKS
jgi:hypothetical protein